jgi:NADPH2:quinone reductase
MGFAVFYAPLEVRRAAYLRLTELAARGGLTVHLEVLPLAEIGAAWHRQRQGNGTKLVIACATAARGSLG